MLSWLLRQLNVTDEFVTHLDEVVLHFQYEWVLWVGLALLVPAGVSIYLRQRRHLASVPPGLRLTLTLTRVFILAILIVAFAGPYLRLDHTEDRKPVVALLFDHSQSMQLPAGPYESEDELLRVARAAGYRTSGNLDSEARRSLHHITRAKLAHSAAKTARPLLEKLARDFDVRYYGFGRDVTRLGIDPAHPDLPEPPNPGGPATDTGKALAHIIEDASDRDLAGMLLFSDGQNTGGRSPDEAARQAAGRGARLFTFPAGSSQRLKDVAIVDLFTTGIVSVGDTARVAVTLESNGFDGRTVKVELKEDNKLLDAKDLVLRGSEQQHLDLTFKADRPGGRYLTVHVSEQPEETDALRRNNTDVAFVRVSDEKLRVLFIEGLPRWDFRFLKNAMRRDHGLGGLTAKEPDVVLEAEWRRLAAKDQAAALPRKLDQLAEYHTIILGDVSPKLLDPAFVALLDRAVRERGVGLIVAAGPLAMPHRYSDRLHRLLPVQLRQGVPGRVPRGVASFRLQLAPEGAVHDAMRFHNEPGRNQTTWASLPPFYWCAAAERAAPAASVLVQNTLAGPYGKLPLIAQHFAGQGKVLFVGTDETWRWRRNVGDRFFYTFWGQDIRSVARRDPKLAKKSWLEVRPIRCQPKEQAQVELMAFTPQGAPLTSDKLSVRAQGGGADETLDLVSDPSVKGRYTGRFTPREAGDYRLTYAGTGKGDAPVEARLRVEPSPAELRQPNVNRPALQRLAAAGRGEMLELHELSSVEGQFKGKPRTTELHRERSLWDNGLVLGVLIFLYALDVGLRRLMGLS